MTLSPADLYDRFSESLTRERRAAVEAVCAAAEALGVPAYLVGGSVRDQLLERLSPDLDIALEGDAPAVAREAAARLGLPPPAVHPAFGTATLPLAGWSLDLITARREHYPAPGALPVVTPAGIDADLRRRDLTINAMALGLTGGVRGRFLDPLGGWADLDAGLVRVLHERSFEDDATRIFRAIRYATRFTFQIEPLTKAAIRRDGGYLAAISPERLRHEFVRAFAEDQPERQLALLDQLGVTPHVLPWLRFGLAERAAYVRLHRTPYSKTELHHFLVPLMDRAPAEIEAYAARLALRHEEIVAARVFPRLHAVFDDRALFAESVPLSEQVAELERFPLHALQVWSLRDPVTPDLLLISRYLKRLRDVRPLLTAADLRDLGIPDGPLMGETLRRLRAARLDDPRLDLDGERAIVDRVTSDE